MFSTCILRNKMLNTNDAKLYHSLNVKKEVDKKMPTYKNVNV